MEIEDEEMKEETPNVHTGVEKSEERKENPQRNQETRNTLKCRKATVEPSMEKRHSNSASERRDKSRSKTKNESKSGKQHREQGLRDIRDFGVVKIRDKHIHSTRGSELGTETENQRPKWGQNELLTDVRTQDF